MRKITAAQNRKIHVVASRLGIDDDFLHGIVEDVTKKEHISSLSAEEAGKVIERLESDRDCKTGNGMTRRQEYFIYFLMKKMGWTDGDGEPDIKRLEGFVKEQHGIDSYRFMSRKVANMVIQAFKKMAARPVKERDKPGGA